MISVNRAELLKSSLCNSIKLTVCCLVPECTGGSEDSTPSPISCSSLTNPNLLLQVYIYSTLSPKSSSSQTNPNILLQV